MQPIDILSLEYKQPGHPVYVGSDILDQLADKLQEHAQLKNIMVVTNNTILNHHGDALGDALNRLKLDPIIIQEKSGSREKNPIVIKGDIIDSEEAKSWEWVSEIIGAMEQHGMDRNSTIIAFGGGVIGDLAGFVAAIYKRGVALVQIPTTLLAQVDSSIGGKVAIDLPIAKNLIGAFYQPQFVYIDTAFLNTLPPEDITSGIAEIIKCGVIMDADFFAYLEENIGQLRNKNQTILRYVVETACQHKINVVKQDPLERLGLRKILNYGHTIGHALEAITDFTRFRHGEAVAIGMVVAMQIAIDLGFVEDISCAERQFNLLNQAGLPTKFPNDINVDALIERMRFDKKGAFRFILPSKIGAIKYDHAENGKVIYDHKVSIEQIQKAIKKVKRET